MLEKADDLNLITIGWKHLSCIAELMHLPKSVFCNFNLAGFMERKATCAYAHKCWDHFLDPNIVDTNTALLLAHVRTTNLDCVQNRDRNLGPSCLVV